MKASRVFFVSAFAAAIIAVLGCSAPVRLPGVHEPLDSKAWVSCAEDLSDRESKAMIDDLTLDSRTLLCQGVVLAVGGSVDEGLDLLTEAAVIDKKDHRPHYLSGRILAEAGRYEEALTAFERSAKRFPSMQVPTERLGSKVLEKEGAQQALNFLEKAEERGLCQYGCMGLLARLHRSAGKVERAEEIYSKMIKSEPKEPDAYIGLAEIRNSQRRFQDEAEYLQKSVSAERFSDLNDGQRAGVHYSLAFARYNAGEYDKASDEINEAASLRSDRADWFVLAGWIYLKRDRPAEALARFKRAQSLDPKLSAAHAGEGDALVAIGDLKGAKSAFGLAHELAPDDSVISLKLAHCAAATGDPETARRLVDEAAKLDKEHLPQDLLDKVTVFLDKEEKSGETDAEKSEEKGKSKK